MRKAANPTRLTEDEEKADQTTSSNQDSTANSESLVPLAKLEAAILELEQITTHFYGKIQSVDLEGFEYRYQYRESLSDGKEFLKEGRYNEAKSLFCLLQNLLELNDPYGIFSTLISERDYKQTVYGEVIYLSGLTSICTGDLITAVKACSSIRFSLITDDKLGYFFQQLMIEQAVEKFGRTDDLCPAYLRKWAHRRTVDLCKQYLYEGLITLQPSPLKQIALFQALFLTDTFLGAVFDIPRNRTTDLYSGRKKLLATELIQIINEDGCQLGPDSDSIRRFQAACRDDVSLPEKIKKQRPDLYTLLEQNNILSQREAAARASIYSASKKKERAAWWTIFRSATARSAGPQVEESEATKQLNNAL